MRKTFALWTMKQRHIDKAVGSPRAKFALSILEKWQQEGAKPVNTIDATMAQR